MCEFDPKNGGRKMDKCMIKEVEKINARTGLTTKSSCCGHSIYPKTIVVEGQEGIIFEYYSNKIIPRKKRFYTKDECGYYYIRETIEGRKKVE